MSPAFIFFILLVIIIALARYLSFFIMNNRKRMEKRFLRLSRQGTAHGLIFYSQEILPNGVMGIDGIHRKIMLIEKQKNSYDCSIICLDEVQSCELVIHYASSSADNNTTSDGRPEAVELLFQFKNSAQPAVVKFYDSLINSKRELELMQAKATYWSTAFLKMLRPQIKVRA